MAKHEIRRISSPGLLSFHPVVRPNNRHSLDVPGPESVKEGQLVSEAVARLGEESLKKKEQARFDTNAAEEAERGSVVVRFNEASIVNGANDDNYEDNNQKNTQDSVSDSDDVVQNSAIDTSSDDDDEGPKKDNNQDDLITARTGTSIPSSASSMAARQAAETGRDITSVTRSCSSRAQMITFQRAEASLLRRMRRATTDLEKTNGDYVSAANVIKSCAEALCAVRKTID